MIAALMTAVNIEYLLNTWIMTDILNSCYLQLFTVAIINI